MIADQAQKKKKKKTSQNKINQDWFVKRQRLVKTKLSTENAKYTTHDGSGLLEPYEAL